MVGAVKKLRGRPKKVESVGDFQPGRRDIVQDNARYGKIVSQRVQRAIGGTSRTSHPEEINNKLSSSGWRLKLGKSTCKAFLDDKSIQHELDLNVT